MRQKLFWLCLCLLPVSACTADRAPLQTAVAAGDWPGVLTLVHAEPPDAVALHVLEGHALLRVGQTNDAVCRFSSADTAGAEWNEWTQSFVKSHPDSTVAHYLRGDALAREREWKTATAEFDRALELDASNVLALNARGVVRALERDWDGASKDLSRADKIDPAFADPHLNLGFSALQFGRAIDGALEAFDDVLKLDSTNVVAFAGRAYAQLAIGSWEEGAASLTAGLGKAGCAQEVLAWNATQVARWLDPLSGDVAADDQLGTPLDRSLSALQKGDIHALSPIVRALGQDPAREKQIRPVLESIQKTNPAYHERIVSQIPSAKEWTQRNGGAEALLRAAESVHVGVGVVTRAIRGGLNLDPAPMIRNQLEKTATDHAGWERLEKIVPQQRPGGATTSLDNARFDRGDLRIRPLYSLMYPVREVGQ